MTYIFASHSYTLIILLKRFPLTKWKGKLNFLNLLCCERARSQMLFAVKALPGLCFDLQLLS